MFNIRRATTQDIPKLMELLRQTATIHHNIRPDIFKSNVTKFTEEELQSILADENKPVFVCLGKDGAVQAYAFCTIMQWKEHKLLEERKTVYIEDLCVDETARGKHIGTALYEYVKAFAESIGADSVTLNVWEGNDSAIAFYKKRGMHVQRYYMEENL